MDGAALIIPKYSSTGSPAFAIGLLALGVLIGLLAYTLFLAISTREKMFRYFSIIMALLTILQTFAAYDRFFFQLTYNRVTLITHVLFITFLLFFEDFFSLSSHKPRLSAVNRVSIYVIAGFTALFFALKSLFPNAQTIHGIVDFIRELFVFYTNIIFLYTIIAAIAWARAEALLILIAFIPPALLTSANALNIFPFMRRFDKTVQFMMTYNQPIGLSLQAVLFSLAMGNRYNRLRAEKERSAKESEKLRQLDNEKTQFFMDMSHETRTPLTIILGLVRQLREGRYGDSIRRNDRVLELVERNGLRLLRQVNHLLRLGRPPDTLAPEDLPADASVRAIMEDFIDIAAQHGVELRFKPGQNTANLILRLGCEDLETVLMNLLSNALKYTPSGGSVIVRTERALDGTFSIEVADTGPGIPEELVKTVFERYRHHPRGIRRFQTGLGLPLIKSIADSYGASIIQRNRPEGGCSFTLSFPAALVKTTGSSSASAKASVLAPLYVADLAGAEVTAGELLPAAANQSAPESAPLILVVEDDSDMRAYIASVLSDRYRVLLAASGEEALSALERKSVDLIVSDMMMPGMDGHRFLAAIREKSKDSITPLIFLTARDSMEERIKSLHEGAIRYITKPFSPDELNAAIHAILEHDRELVGNRVERLRRGIATLLDDLEKPPIKDEPKHFDLRRFALDIGLTDRETEITKLIIAGKSDKDIAASLHLSPRTIANHNRRIYVKAGVGGRFELLSKIFGDDQLSSEA